MNTITNAMPQARILGFQDLSGGTPVYETTPVPTHLPLFFIQSEKGPAEAQLVSGDAIEEIYGSETFNTRGKFYNHQTAFLDRVRARQSVMIQRVMPADIGPEARLLLSIDIVEELIPQYERLSDGSFKYDPNTGAKIPTGDTVNGYKAKWVVNDWVVGVGDNSVKAFGQMTQKVGTLTNEAVEQSTQYPILELKVSTKGSHGNNLGVRLSAPTTQSAAPVNESLVAKFKAYLYRLQLIKRASATSTGQTVESVNGDQFIDVGLVEGLYDEATNSDFSAQDILIQSYESLDNPGVPDIIGSFSDLKIYDANLKAVLAMVGAAEAPLGLIGQDVLDIDADSEFLHLVNIFTGRNLEGVEYGSLQLLGPADGGVYLSENTSLYAAGGTDGTTTLAKYDEAVGTLLDGWLSPSHPMLDWARFPFSTVYDSGFSLATKKKFFLPMAKRPDVWAVVSTQDVSLPQNSPSEDSSIAIALRAAAAAYPESVLYGTPVARAMIIGQSGKPLNTTYKGGILPLSWQFASMCAAFMGAATGEWDEDAAIDKNPNNLVTDFRGVNNTYKPVSTRKNDWDNGLVWAQYFDHKSLFFPAFQTVYDDDTSVLNSAVTMFAAVEAVKAAQRSWRVLSGRSDLTPAQVIKENNATISADLAESRFNGRFTFVVETFYTAADTQRGYSYSCRINIYAPNMISVGSFTVGLHRRADAGTGA